MLRERVAPICFNVWERRRARSKPLTQARTLGSANEATRINALPHERNKNRNKNRSKNRSKNRNKNRNETSKNRLSLLQSQMIWAVAAPFPSPLVSSAASQLRLLKRTVTRQSFSEKFPQLISRSPIRCCRSRTQTILMSRNAPVTSCN